MNNTPTYDALQELALDLIWSWNRSADLLWEKLDKELWQLTHNPWVVLQTVSPEKLKNLLSDASFCKAIHDLLDTKKQEADSPAWFQKNHPNSPLTTVAYFSMEFMLSEALPIYSGGLGNVAGDQLKAASDMDVPVIGIGLLYQQGYFRQTIDREGRQQALYPYNDPGQLPIKPLRRANGEWLRLEVKFPGWSVWIRAWEAAVGRRKLYLLDSNDAANYPAHRGITSELYGGDSELRLKQELILGICGWRLLQELGIKPQVCHLNEGHAAFATLERAYSFMKDASVSFEVALQATRAGNLFTTHTAVPAGFDRFEPCLIEHYLGSYAAEKLKISVQQLLDLGRQNPSEPFNMAYLAMRGSGFANGVSLLHGKVSRHLFEPLFPRWPQKEVPIGSITNGVHMPTWDFSLAEELWNTSCGRSGWLGSVETLEEDFRKVSDKQLWNMRNEARKSIIEYSRSRLSRQLAARGSSKEDVEKAKSLFDPNTLTLGFARRFATYKRANMLLHDQERLLRILNHPQRPVQLIIAGKAHPADRPGQAMIQEWMRFIQRPEARSRVIFLSDYDMMLTEKIILVDVWINTPRRPWEASGTSGMKVLVNGGLNLSELDGWWAEAYCPEVGWALGDGQEHGEDPAWDAFEANKLYETLEKEVIPEFYERNQEGLPSKWLSKMRESMARLTPRFCANRAVHEYTEKYYLPAAQNVQKRTANGAAIAKAIVEWKHEVQKHWQALRFHDVQSKTEGGEHLFEAKVYLDALKPDYVKIELYAEGKEEPFRQEMKRVRDLKESPGMFLYQAFAPSARAAAEYTARIVPSFAEAEVPLEANQILWQK